MNPEKTAQSNIICEARKKLYLTGVTDTECFNEKEAVLFTVCGKLSIKGSDLNVIRLSVEDGEVIIEGDINSLIYSDEADSRKESFLSRLFK